MEEIAEYKKVIEKQKEELMNYWSEMELLKEENMRLKKENEEKQRVDYDEMRSMIVAMKI